MNDVIRPMNYREIKTLLEQIDRAESAKKVILQAKHALTTNDDDSLFKLGFSDEHITELKNRNADGKAHSHFVCTTTLDNVLSRLRHELREVVKHSISSKEFTNSEVPVTQTSRLISSVQEIDYLSLLG